MDNRIPNRIVIYTKDIQNITGRKERTARKLMSELKRKVGKQEYGFLTVEEFCKLTGFKEEQIRPFLK
ncbi:MAG: hypothetical protein SFY32_05555 [Bacteroidota bacterium]|nr:hypothetical protein [Bacteroidota bacterium]